MTAPLALIRRFTRHACLATTLIEPTFGVPTLPGPIGPPPSNDPVLPTVPADSELEDNSPGEPPGCPREAVLFRSTTHLLRPIGVPPAALPLHGMGLNT